MILQNLKDLHSSMGKQGIGRYRFDYKHGKVKFDIFFFIDSKPNILLFGACGGNFSFEIDVDESFSINPNLPKETYKKLCALLCLKFDPSNRFSPAAFFFEFDQLLPKGASTTQIARPEEIIVYHQNLEEAHKRWFCGWRDNNHRGQSVTFANLEKTRKLLGERVFQRCKLKNISSCWTDDSSRATEICLT